MKPNEKGGAGYLGYEDKTFTIATAPDQWICTTINNLSSQPTTMNEPAQPAPVGKPIRYLSVCSGMEAASVAWHPLGWTPVGFSEIEPFPCAILKHRFPNVPNYGSLTEYQSWPIEPGAIDLLVGGTPCQSYSVAGKRGGLNDPRGQLMLCFLDLAARLKPKYIIWENVPGVLSSGQPRGSDFATFLQGLVERGYGWAYRVLDAQYVGGPRAVPQRRRRVFVVACLGDWRAPAEVLSLREGLRGYLEAGGKKRKGAAAGAEGGAGADHPEGCWWDGGQVSQTLDAVLQKGQTMPEKNRFPAVLQPKPVAFKVRGGGNYSGTKGGEVKPDEKGGTGYLGYEDKTFTVATTQDQWVAAPITQSDIAGPLDAHYYKGPGSRAGGEREYVAHPIPYRKSKRAQSTTDNETWVPADVTNTLNNFDLGDTRTTHAVVEPFAWTQNQRDEVRVLGDKAGALALPGTHQSNYIAEPKVYENHAQDSRVSGPLDVAPTVAAKFGTGGGNVPLVGAMAVRRLTPVECERLQGFPDNWSRISWKGKPAEECPDGPRYKACGNSMAVPCMRWIGERIAAVEASSHA